ncbi:hypothetical protein [Nannocystis pusilla]|uniref:hypothetical protein n=1 Tax=Nannocystis pusilla TaxID=889268 RepID=UPI003BEF7021
MLKGRPRWSTSAGAVDLAFFFFLDVGTDRLEALRPARRPTALEDLERGLPIAAERSLEDDLLEARPVGVDARLQEGILPGMYEYWIIAVDQPPGAPITQTFMVRMDPKRNVSSFVGGRVEAEFAAGEYRLYPREELASFLRSGIDVYTTTLLRSTPLSRVVRRASVGLTTDGHIVLTNNALNGHGNSADKMPIVRDDLGDLPPCNDVIIARSS